MFLALALGIIENRIVQLVFWIAAVAVLIGTWLLKPVVHTPS
jgi:hypothetical protein